MDALLNKLKTETATLKEQFLTATESWTNSEIDRLVALDGPNTGKETRAEYAEKQLASQLKWESHWAVPKFKANAKKGAEQHYENSIIKLADRIAAKGLNIEAIQIKTGYVGVNIEMTLTDGVKSISAWTIIASGCIQKPHYRYLIK